MRNSDTPAPDHAGDAQPAVPEMAEAGQDDPLTNPAQKETSAEPIVVLASNRLEPPGSKILELREQYLEGTYKVDAKELSSRIINEHLRK